MRGIESSDPKISATISKVETNEEIKSDFEATKACILPHDPAANNKVCSNKNQKNSASNVGITSMIGGRDKETKLDSRFYDHKECKTLINTDKGGNHQILLSL